MIASRHDEAPTKGSLGKGSSAGPVEDAKGTIKGEPRSSAGPK